MYLFRYKVSLDVSDTTGLLFGQGVVFAKNYGEAAGKMEEYYKTELYSIDFLAPIADGEVIPLDKENEEFIESIQKNWIW